ncbi:PAS domain S-box protein [Candidatus Roizmanbacteria bacterium]|nr:PAS domain S-box protein [Candidatus Roizmanbacteria bacterium]
MAVPLLGNYHSRSGSLILERRLSFGILTGILIGISALALTSSWHSNNALHALLELSATVLALTIAAMALIKFYTRHNNKYVFIGFGFLGAALIDGYRAVVMTSLLPTTQKTTPLLTQSWIISSLLLSCFLLTSLLVWWYEKHHQVPTPTFKKFIYPSIIGILVFVMLWILLTPLLSIGWGGTISVLFFTVSFIGYLVKGYWQRKYFEFWLTMALITLVFSQFLYLTSSYTFAAPATFAHLLKNIAYSFTLTGLLMSMYVAFQDVEESRDKINAILTSIGDGVFVVNTHGSIILMNTVAEHLSGFTFAESRGKNYHSIFHFISEDEPEKPYPPFVEEVINTGTIRGLGTHTLLIQKDGTTIPVSDSAAPIMGKSGGAVLGCIVVIRDVSRERELERTKDNFLSVAAHQLRTPLGAMRWNMEMLLNGDLGKLTKSVKQTIEQIYESNHRMINLVNDLLNVSRIDQRRVANHPKHTTVESVLHTVVQEMQAEAFKRRVTLVVHQPKIHTEPLLIDPDRLHEVIINLVSNGIKYNRPSGTVTLSLNQQSESIQLIVSDTGMGIPLQDRAELFSKFFRASNALASATDGSGLGLFVVKSYIEGWGGTVTYDSIPGKGTTFTITIPKHPILHTLDKNLAAQPHVITPQSEVDT